MRAGAPSSRNAARGGNAPEAATIRSTSRSATPVRATISSGACPASAATARMRRPSRGAASSSASSVSLSGGP